MTLDLHDIGEKLKVLDSDPCGTLTLAEEKALLAEVYKLTEAIKLTIARRNLHYIIEASK